MATMSVARSPNSCRVHSQVLASVVQQAMANKRLRAHECFLYHSFTKPNLALNIKLLTLSVLTWWWTFLVSAIVSDIDSDYTSDINYPVGYNSHHNNISVHQIGAGTYAKPHSLHSPSPNRHNPVQNGNGDVRGLNNYGGDSLDYSSQPDDYFMSDGDYDPSNEYRDEYSIGDKSYDEDRDYRAHHENNNNEYYRDHENNQRNLQTPSHEDLVRGGAAYIEHNSHNSHHNVSHTHWEMNGYHYQEYDDVESEFSTNASSRDYPHNRPVPRARGSPVRGSPVRGNFPPTPAARSPGRSPGPVPRPRKTAVCDNSDNTSSPYYERRSDTSDPLFYNSRPAEEGYVSVLKIFVTRSK